MSFHFDAQKGVPEILGLWYSPAGSSCRLRLQVPLRSVPTPWNAMLSDICLELSAFELMGYGP